MAKYILKESELRAMIDNIVEEEINNVINEGLGTAALNTVKNGALGVVAPTLLAQKYLTTMDRIINGDAPVRRSVEAIKDYFGATGSQKAKREAKKNEREARRRQRQQRRRR